MMWFLALLAVGVLGVVAVVAAGRGGHLAEVYDDRPDSRVQAEGPLRAQDLRTVRFSTALRGYRMVEVDTLLDRLAAELELRDAESGPVAGPGVEATPEQRAPRPGGNVEFGGPDAR